MAQIKERIQLSYLAALTGGNGSLTEDSFKQELIKEFGSSKITDDTIETSEDGKIWTVTIDGASTDVKAVANTPSQKKLGDAYEENWIGKTIEYSANGVSNWIIIGQDKTTKNVLITTANPVGSIIIGGSLEDWCDYESTLNTACSNYSGKIAGYDTTARSITLEDINNAVGFTVPESVAIDEFTFGTNHGWNNTTETWDSNEVNYYYPDETNKTWIVPTSSNPWKHNNDAYYYYNNNGVYKFGSAKTNMDENEITLTSNNLRLPDNMRYILADNNDYCVASRSIYIESEYANFNLAYVIDGKIGNDGGMLYSNASGGYDGEDSDPIAIRPVIILSSEIPFQAVKDLILLEDK